MDIEIREINMPIQALDARCKDCPSLKIEIERETGVLLNHTETVGKIYKNTLACANVDRCKLLMEWLAANNRRNANE